VLSGTQRTDRLVLELQARVWRFRHRWMLAVLVRSLAAGILIYTGISISAGVIYRITLSNGVTGFPLGLSMVMLLLFLVIWTGVAIVSMIRTPDARLAARFIDDRAELAGRVSTVLEVVQRPAPNRVERALLASIPDWIGAVNPRRLITPLLPRWSIWILPAVLAWSLLALLPVPVAGAAVLPPAVEFGPVSVEAVEIVAKVQRVARLLARDAGARRDPYLRTMASAFSDLGHRLSRGELLPAAAQRELDGLLSRVAGSYGLAEDPTYRGSDGVSDDAGDNGLTTRPATSRATTPVMGTEESEAVIEASTAPRSKELTLDTLLERLETEALARATPDTDANLEDVRFRPGTGRADDGLYFDNPELQAANEQLLDSLRRGATRPDAGGAIAGDAAGAGGAEAGGTTLALNEGVGGGRSLQEFELEREAITLPHAARNASRRLQVMAAPSTRLSEVGDAEALEPSWQRTVEVPVLTETVGLEYRVLLSRYFTPDTSALDTVGPASGQER
jgi:hypothetical protein